MLEDLMGCPKRAIRIFKSFRWVILLMPCFFLYKMFYYDLRGQCFASAVLRKSVVLLRLSWFTDNFSWCFGWVCVVFLLCLDMIVIMIDLIFSLNLVPSFVTS